MFSGGSDFLEILKKSRNHVLYSAVGLGGGLKCVGGNKHWTNYIKGECKKNKLANHCYSILSESRASIPAVLLFWEND